MKSDNSLANFWEQYLARFTALRTNAQRDGESLNRFLFGYRGLDEKLHFDMFSDEHFAYRRWDSMEAQGNLFHRDQADAIALSTDPRKLPGSFYRGGRARLDEELATGRRAYDEYQALEEIRRRQRDRDDFEQRRGW